jgi:hypothetical protein
MDIESVREKKTCFSWLPVVSVCIGTFALCFQVFVLYPWHLQLSSEFADMQRICLESKTP